MTQKKKVRAVLLAAVMVFLPIFLFAQEMNPQESIDTIITGIQREQGVESIDQIDLDRVSPNRIEKLGESVSDMLIANDRQREWMDEMMGGEGSDELKSMYRFIGYNYIVDEGDIDAWDRDMMGIETMGWGMRGGRYGPVRGVGWDGPWLWIIGLVFLIAIIALLAALLFRKPKGKLKKPMEIAKDRFARGEISWEEFQRMKEELK